MKQNPKRIGRTDISDLNEDPVVVWQHRHYLKVVLFMGLVFPMLVCGIGWGDWLGGFVYGGILRIFLSSKLHSASTPLLIGSAISHLMTAILPATT